MAAILNRVIKVDLMEKVTLEQTLEGDVGVIYTDIRWKSKYSPHGEQANTGLRLGIVRRSEKSWGAGSLKRFCLSV